MLRRYRIKANDYEHVLKWVQEQPAILQDDEEDEKAAEVDLKDFLKGSRFSQDTHPLVTNQIWVGDNWFTCESHGPEGFGIFVRAVWNRLHEDRADEQVQEPPDEEE